MLPPKELLINFSDNPSDPITGKMILVEGGTFMMGCELRKRKPYGSEMPAHEVTLNSYYIGETPVTQAQWVAVMKNIPPVFYGNDHPVERLSWGMIQEFVNKLNAHTGKTFRVPTEAEWEYAAVGGRESKGYFYCGSDLLDEVAWYKDNAGGHTHPVKGKKPNELGLYDMSGNVFEFCQDHWHGDYQGAPTNGEAWESTVHPDRVIRGGAWFARARLCRPTYRNHTTFLNEGLGFRLVCGGGEGLKEKNP